MALNFDELTKTKVKIDKNSILYNGYGLIPKEIMRNKNITAQAKAIYSYLASFAGSDGIAYPTQEKMMDELCMNKTTFNKYLKEILSTGYIKVDQTRKDGKIYKNVYTIALDKRDLEANRKAYVKIAKQNKKKSPSKQVNNLPSQCIKICDIDDQCHKKQETKICDSISNSFTSNSVDVDESDKSKYEKIEKLYIDLKLEKRPMPHTKKLLKKVSDIFEYDLIESILILSENEKSPYTFMKNNFDILESANNKFENEIIKDVLKMSTTSKVESISNYMRKIFITLEEKKIFDFNSYDKYCFDFQKSKPSKQVKSKNIKPQNKSSYETPTVKTRFHNINQTFKKYTPEELEKMLLENQKRKDMKEKKYKTKFHNFSERPNKYTPEELEKILFESQKDKFKSENKSQENNLYYQSLKKEVDEIADPAFKSYKEAIDNNWENISIGTRTEAILYAQKYNKPYPNK